MQLMYTSEVRRRHMLMLITVLTVAGVVVLPWRQADLDAAHDALTTLAADINSYLSRV
jgi:hypothetical protein